MTEREFLSEFVKRGSKKRHPSGYYYECRYCLGAVDGDSDHYDDCLWLRAKQFLNKTHEDSRRLTKTQLKGKEND